MKIDLKLLALILLFCFATVPVAGCGGDDGPVTPATTDEVPTSEEPTEPEPVLPEEGP
jgi:hypothetical protein